MKIVLLGESKELRNLSQILSFLKFVTVLFSDKKYEIKADDCVIFDDEMKNSEQIVSLFGLKLREQQVLKIWSISALRAEFQKFGYDRDNQESDDLNLIFNFLFTGKKLPYDLINKNI